MRRFVWPALPNTPGEWAGTHLPTAQPASARPAYVKVRQDQRGKKDQQRLQRASPIGFVLQTQI